MSTYWSETFFKSSDAFSKYVLRNLREASFGGEEYAFRAVASLQHFNVLPFATIAPSPPPRLHHRLVRVRARNPMSWGCALNRSRKRFCECIRIKGPMAAIQPRNYTGLLHLTQCA